PAGVLGHHEPPPELSRSLPEQLTAGLGLAIPPAASACHGAQRPTGRAVVGRTARDRPAGSAQKFMNPLYKPATFRYVACGGIPPIFSAPRGTPSPLS
ncbi:MAG: hypothetical protein ACK56F_03020, partial [bacterium]